MSKLFYKNSLDWEILLAYFPDQIFFRWKEKSPFRFRDAGVNHSFPFGLVGKWQSLFLPHSAQKLLDSAENWRQRAMVWSSAEKNKNNLWLFSSLRAAPDHSQERTYYGRVKSSKCLQERYQLQEKLFLYISVLLRNVGYHLVPRWLTALFCAPLIPKSQYY